MAKIEKYTESLSKELEKNKLELETVRNLTSMFPDLETFTGRWNKMVFMCAAVNSKVEGYDSRHNCGCCDDSPLEIWPYMNTAYGRVYSKPAMFMVGEKDPYHYFRHIPYPKWEEELKKAQIPEWIIKKIGDEYFPPEEEEYECSADYEVDEV